MQSQQNKYWGSDCRTLFQVFPKLTWDKINFCHSRTLKVSIDDDSIWPDGKQFCNKAIIHNLQGKKRQKDRKKASLKSLDSAEVVLIQHPVVQDYRISIQGHCSILCAAPVAKQGIKSTLNSKPVHTIKTGLYLSLWTFWSAQDRS